MHKKYGAEEVSWLKDKVAKADPHQSWYTRAKALLPEFVSRFNKPTTLAGFRNFMDRTLYPERYAKYVKSYQNRKTRRAGRERLAPSIVNLNLDGDNFLLITKKLGAKGFRTIEDVKVYMLGNGITGARLYSITPINVNVDIRIDGGTEKK